MEIDELSIAMIVGGAVAITAVCDGAIIPCLIAAGVLGAVIGAFDGLRMNDKKYWDAQVERYLATGEI